MEVEHGQKPPGGLDDVALSEWSVLNAARVKHHAQSVTCNVVKGLRRESG